MRQPKRSFRGLFHCVWGVVLTVAIVTLVVVMFAIKPVVDEHEDIRLRTIATARVHNYEWVPIENLDLEIKHQTPAYVLTMYRVVIYALITRCNPEDVRRLLGSILSSSYLGRPFSVDIHVEVRCPLPKDTPSKQDWDAVQDMITSLRWTDGRVTGHQGSPISSTSQFLVEDWLPITNWEISVFFEEGQAVKSVWFAKLMKGLQLYAIRKSEYRLPTKERAPRTESWRIQATILDLTPKRFLGFSLFHSASSNSPSFALQELTMGLVIFPSKWIPVQRKIRSRPEYKNQWSNTTWINESIVKAMSEDELYLIYVGPKSTVWKLGEPEPEEQEGSPSYLPLSSLPLYNAAKQQLMQDTHVFDSVGE